LGERRLCKPEVAGSIPAISTMRILDNRRKPAATPRIDIKFVNLCGGMIRRDEYAIFDN
jgi:hypothetical protein